MYTYIYLWMYISIYLYTYVFVYYTYTYIESVHKYGKCGHGPQIAKGPLCVFEYVVLPCWILGSKTDPLMIKQGGGLPNLLHIYMNIYVHIYDWNHSFIELKVPGEKTKSLLSSRTSKLVRKIGMQNQSIQEARDSSFPVQEQHMSYPLCWNLNGDGIAVRVRVWCQHLHAFRL